MEGHRSFKKPKLASHNSSNPPNPPNPPSSSQPSSQRHRGSYNPRMTTQEKLDDVMGYLHKYRWSFRDFIRHLVHNYASKLIEAIWSDNEVIQKLQNEPSFKDATTGVEVYKRELTALESTNTFGRYTRTLEFNNIQMEEVHAELRR